MHHLVQDDDVVRGLEDLQILVVPGRHDRRAGVKTEQAALGQTTVLPAVGADPSRPNPHWTRPSDILTKRQLHHVQSWLQLRHSTGLG